MNLREWIEIPGNMDRYKVWLNDPITKEMLACWGDHFTPRPFEHGNEKVETALYLHGQTVATHQILTTLKTLDNPLPSGGDISASYGLVQELRDQGYSETDARRMATDAIKESNEPGQVNYVR